VLTSATPARAATAVSNVNNPDPATYFDPVAATSFTTGDQPAILNSISAPYFCTSSSFGMDLVARLFADSGTNSPGTMLEEFPEQTGPAGVGTATFPSAGTLLAPHTTYWFYLSRRTATEWEVTTLPTETSDYGWTIGDQVYNGLYTPGAGRFSVDVTFVPEPSTLALTTLPALALLPRRRRYSPRYVR
jgi:hypothetical protein